MLVMVVVVVLVVLVMVLVMGNVFGVGLLLGFPSLPSVRCQLRSFEHILFLFAYFFVTTLVSTQDLSLIHI